MCFIKVFAEEIIIIKKKYFLENCLAYLAQKFKRNWHDNSKIATERTPM